MIRLLDISLSAAALLFLLPILLPVMLVLRLTGEGEVFYPQNRVGKHGKVFKLFKFATMLKDSPNLGSGTLTLNNDPRILPIGRFLRKAKINELPQLLNVLIGDMSLVGPRPQARVNFEMYSEADRNIITSVKPGLTGLGSFVFSNEEQLLGRHEDPECYYENVIMPFKAKLEVWFVTNYSFRLYLMLIFMTAAKIIFHVNLKNWIKDVPVLPKELES